MALISAAVLASARDHRGDRLLRHARRPTAEPASGRSTSSALLVVGLEVGLAGAADRAEPVVRDVVECGAGRDAAVGVALGRVVDEPARGADPELLGLGRCSRAGRFQPRAATRDRMQDVRSMGRMAAMADASPDAAGARNPFEPGLRARRRPAGRDDHPAAPRRQARSARARGAAGPAHGERAVHARRLGLSRRPGRGRRADRRRRRRPRPTSTPTSWRTAPPRSASWPRRPASSSTCRAELVPLVALDHAGAGPDPLRHPLLHGAGPRPLAARARRLGDHRRGLDEPADALEAARRARSSWSSRRSSSSSRSRPFATSEDAIEAATRHRRRADHAERRAAEAEGCGREAGKMLMPGRPRRADLTERSALSAAV